jgi:beta-phosphoglucomutase-like phosphatase (HAD superfamily)
VGKIKAVIFDMDGVLIDSEWFIAEAARLMFKETHNLDVSPDDFPAYVGKGENRFLGGVAEKYGLAGFDITRDKARTYVIYDEIAKDKLKPLPGALEFVRHCRGLGLKTAFATSADYPKVVINLKALGLTEDSGAVMEAGGGNKMFDAMVHGLDVQRHKPFPDIFLKAASRLGVDGADCWVVEDALSGIEAAKAADMRCLALLTSFSRDKIEAAGPDKIAADLSAITPEELL